MLDLIEKDVLRFGDMSYLDASPCEHFKFIIKAFIKMTSTIKASTIEEVVLAMNKSSTNSHD